MKQENVMYAEATSSRVWDVTEHVFAVLAAAKHSDLLRIYIFI